MADLCLIEDVLLHLRIDSINPSDGGDNEVELIGKLITAISDRIEKITGRTFSETSYTEYYDGTGTNEIVLNQFPIISLTSINYVNTDDTSSTSIDTNSVHINYDKGILLYRGGIFSAGKRNLLITYTAGYADIPYDLELIAIELTVDAYNRSKKDNNIKSEKIGDYSYVLSSNSVFNNDIINKLSRYQDINFSA